MPSEPIASRQPNPIDLPSGVRIVRRATRAAALFGLVLLLLAGCAEGTSRDAERGRQADTERTSVVDSLQATSSADLVLRAGQATPPPADAASTEPASDAEGN